MKRYIVGGTLIDGTGQPALPLHWLELDGERITAVEAGHGPGAPLPPGAVVECDATGKTVMPGLIDAHCHISYGVAKGIEEQDLFGSAEYRAIRGTYHARTVLLSGVTAFSDPGGSWFVAVAVRDAIKAGIFPGPRISAAAKYLSTHAALTDYFPSWIGAPVSGVGALTENTSQMLGEVRNQIKKLQEDGYGHYPVCVAKTQSSFSTDASLRGAPEDHTVNIREVRLAAGAEFVVMVCGDIMTMPGLPKVPSAEVIRLNDDGNVEGLF